METDRIAPSTAPNPVSPRPASIEVEISDTQSHLAADPDFIEALVRRVLLLEGIERASISIALVDDPTIHAINRRHLSHDWPTDVITFVLSEPDDATLAGELVVSAEMAAATALEAGVDPRSELALYVVHGLLHLCGLDDQSAEDADVMRRREGEILASEGLINTFPLVAGARPDDEGREMMSWPR
jgi:probable rRNA maturation factor